MLAVKNKLYIFLGTACFLGYLWFFANLKLQWLPVGCLFKKITNLPCPACGNTRAAMQIWEGNYLTAFNINPLGFLIAALMLVVPVWLFIDVAFKKQTLFNAYHKSQLLLKKQFYYLPAAVLIIANWVWNILKHN
jgi:hypothetical protein